MPWIGCGRKLLVAALCCLMVPAFAVDASVQCGLGGLFGAEGREQSKSEENDGSEKESLPQSAAHGRQHTPNKTRQARFLFDVHFGHPHSVLPASHSQLASPYVNVRHSSSDGMRVPLRC